VALTPQLVAVTVAVPPCVPAQLKVLPLKDPREGSLTEKKVWALTLEPPAAALKTCVQVPPSD
jgi:hypothetical protein